MSEPTAYPPVALEALRERTIQALCEHFAADHISADELERRLDGVHAAATPVALRALTADLPAPGAGAAAAPRYAAVSRSDTAPDTQVVVAVMGESRRGGVWTPARSLRVLAVMGGATLDFREAAFGPGVTEVSVLAIMGGVHIVVPPGLRVESNGMGIMGGFEHRGSTAAPSADPGSPVLRITGLALMGGVEIHVRLPGERAADARRREKLERREARRLARGHDDDD